MYQKKKFPYNYIEDLKCRVLELPYQGKELSMIILLPDDIEDESTGLEKVRPLPSSSCVLSVGRFCLVCMLSGRCLLCVYWCHLTFLSCSLSLLHKLAINIYYSKALSSHFQLLSVHSCGGNI